VKGKHHVACSATGANRQAHQYAARTHTVVIGLRHSMRYVEPETTRDCVILARTGSAFHANAAPRHGDLIGDVLLTSECVGMLPQGYRVALQVSASECQ